MSSLVIIYTQPYNANLSWGMPSSFAATTVGNLSAGHLQGDVLVLVDL